MRFGPKSDPNNVAKCTRCKGTGIVGRGTNRASCPSCLARQTARNYANDTNPNRIRTNRNNHR